MLTPASTAKFSFASFRVISITIGSPPPSRSRLAPGRHLRLTMMPHYVGASQDVHIPRAPNRFDAGRGVCSPYTFTSLPPLQITWLHLFDLDRTRAEDTLTTVNSCIENERSVVFVKKLWHRHFWKGTVKACHHGMSLWWELWSCNQMEGA